MDRTKKCRLQFKKVSIQNRKEFKRMPNSHWNKASNHTFQDKSVVNTHPNREGCRHMLKSSELGQGWQKALWSLDWPDQESNLHPVSTKRARETHKGKKIGRKQQDHLETLQKARNTSSVWFQPQNMAMTSAWDAAAQPGNDDTWGFTTSTWTSCLRKSGCWGHQPWTHRIYLFFWLMLWAWPWATSPSQYDDSCICPNLPCDSREPRNALSHGGHRNPFCRWKSTYILVAVTIKIFQGAKRASVKVVLPSQRIQR